MPQKTGPLAAPPGGVGGTTYPPLLRYVPRRGYKYNAIYVVGLLYTKEMLIVFLAQFYFPVS